MYLLLHICCGVCLGGPFESLRNTKVRIQGYFYNPNIHPFAEFMGRMDALRILQEAQGISIRYEEGYGLEDFLRDALPNDEHRCLRCYRMRLRRTAQRAKEMGCDAFSTTLLVSRHQKHELIRQAGTEAAQEFGIPFHYEDWRPLNLKSFEAAKSSAIYRQRYCGCIFSEYEASRRQNDRRIAR